MKYAQIQSDLYSRATQTLIHARHLGVTSLVHGVATMTRLSELPPEILGEILTGKHYSYLVIALWKCGDLRLNRNLANGITYINLKDTKLTSTSRYPKLLSQLKNLRYLSLDRGKHPLNGEPWCLAAELLLLQGSKLETLQIVESKAFQSLFAYSAPVPPHTTPTPIYTQHSNGTSRFLDFSTLFPLLTKLKFGPETRQGEHLDRNPWGDLAGLPPALTRLSMGHVSYVKPQGTPSRVMALLPRSLISWKLFGKFHGTFAVDDPFWVDPPPHLQVLDKIHSTLIRGHHNYECLPRTLTHLSFRPPNHASFHDNYLTLPPTLTSLGDIVGYIAIDLSLTKSSTNFGAWGALKKLKRLVLRFSGSSALGFPDFIPSLPDTVQMIELRYPERDGWAQMVENFLSKTDVSGLLISPLWPLRK